MKRRLFVLTTTLGSTALVVLTFYFLGIIFKLSQLALSGREGTSGLSSSIPLLLPLKVIILRWFSYFYQRGDFLVTPSHFAARILEELTKRPCFFMWED